MKRYAVYMRLQRDGWSYLRSFDSTKEAESFIWNLRFTTLSHSETSIQEYESDQYLDLKRRIGT